LVRRFLHRKRRAAAVDRESPDRQGEDVMPGRPCVRLLVAVAHACAAAGAVHAQVPTLPTQILPPQPIVAIDAENMAGIHWEVGVNDATRLPDGRFVVAACGTSELRYFDPDGLPVRSVRLEPADSMRPVFRMDNLFPAGGDTVAVVENAYIESVAHFYDGQGNPVRTQRIPLGAAPKGRLADGRLVAVRWDSHLSVRLDSLYQAPPPGIDTIRATLLTVDASGAVQDSVGGLFAGEVEIDPDGNIRRGLRFRRFAFTAVLADGVAYGNQLEPAFDVYDAALRHIGQVTAGEPGAPVTDEDRERWSTEKASLVPDGSRRFPSYGRLAAPVHPAYGDVVAGRDGDVWVQDAERIGSYPLIWTRYRGGRPVARLQLHPRFYPFEFGADWVLGVRVDPSNVETVELYEMVPGDFQVRELPHSTAAVPYDGCGARWSR
jgi:hypothetical protein